MGIALGLENTRKLSVYYSFHIFFFQSIIRERYATDTTSVSSSNYRKYPLVSMCKMQFLERTLQQ